MKGIRTQSVKFVIRFLTEQGLSEEAIDRGLTYAEEVGAPTTRRGSSWPCRVCCIQMPSWRPGFDFDFQVRT